MKKTNFQVGSKKPDIEVNKPPEQKFWQKPGIFPIWYFIIALSLLYLFQTATQIKKEEIPYSQFQQYLAEGQIVECVIKEKVITGTLRLTDQKSGKPRHFVTVPLYNSDLVNALEEHGVNIVATDNASMEPQFKDCGNMRLWHAPIDKICLASMEPQFKDCGNLLIGRWPCAGVYLL